MALCSRAQTSGARLRASLLGKWSVTCCVGAETTPRNDDAASNTGRLCYVPRVVGGRGLIGPHSRALSLGSFAGKSPPRVRATPTGPMHQRPHFAAMDRNRTLYHHVERSLPH